MKTLLNVRVMVVVCALLPAACDDDPSGTAGDGGLRDAAAGDTGGGGADTGGGGTDTGGGASDTGGGDAPVLTFMPSNIPATVLAGGAPGDMIFNGTNCGGSTAIINTNTGMIRMCQGLDVNVDYRYMQVAQSDGSMVAVFLTRTFRIDTTLTVSVEGQFPLVIVAFDRAEILGALDAAPNDVNGVAGGFSGRDNMKGPGSGPGAGQSTMNGGGGGGSYCGVGGKGGFGNAGGSKYGTPELEPIIGGSSGAAGGIWGSGAGGGAVQIVAGSTLSVTATGSINVGGAGGMQSGGGGGSGGALLLEAPMVIMSGILAANGGGGGSGTGAIHGQDAQANDQVAKGGADAMMTAVGGDGSAAAVLNGTDGKPNPTFADGNFSGGGGAGAGRIRINTMGGAAMLSGKVSPSVGTECVSQGML